MVLFGHFISLGLINAWLLYQCDSGLLGINKKGIMKLRQVQGLVAQGLIEVGMCRKRVRPSLNEESAPIMPLIFHQYIAIFHNFDFNPVSERKQSAAIKLCAVKIFIVASKYSRWDIRPSRGNRPQPIIAL
jgi:hypothetical protein